MTWGTPKINTQIGLIHWSDGEVPCMQELHVPPEQVQRTRSEPKTFHHCKRCKKCFQKDSPPPNSQWKCALIPIWKVCETRRPWDKLQAWEHTAIISICTESNLWSLYRMQVRNYCLKPEKQTYVFLSWHDGKNEPMRKRSKVPKPLATIFWTKTLPRPRQLSFSCFSKKRHAALSWKGQATIKM